jgi:hypothetical protein
MHFRYIKFSFKIVVIFLKITADCKTAWNGAFSPLRIIQNTSLSVCLIDVDSATCQRKTKLIKVQAMIISSLITEICEH